MQNKYEEGKHILINSNLELKSIKMFRGREGHGCSANIYWNGKRCGEFLDEANGGEYFIDWNHKDKNSEEAWEFLMSLPKFSHNEWLRSVNHRSGPIGDGKDDIRDTHWKWYWCDALISRYEEKKQMNKWLRTVQVFFKKEKLIRGYKCKTKDLGKQTRHEGKDITLLEYFNNLGLVLNNLPKEEAYEYFDKYVK